MENYLEKYNLCLNNEEIGKSLEQIASNIEELKYREAFLKCFSFMDLTTLHTEDTIESVSKLVAKVNDLKGKYPDYPLPASVCVFPNFSGVVARERNTPEVHVTAAAACFPASQSFLEVKLKECEMAVANGAEEIDVVLPLNSFLAGDYEAASAEIKAIRSAIGEKITLKVILETGLLLSPEKIAEASFLAMESGADFIKTSTGKASVNATPSAAYVICLAIKAYYEATGRKVGFKAAGGISSAMDALCYYSIAFSVLGSEWLDKSLFRLGVSRLGNALMSAIEGETINYF